MKELEIRGSNLLFLITYKLIPMRNAIHNNQILKIDIEPNSGNMYGRKNGKNIFILEFFKFTDRMKLTNLKVFQENKGFGSFALKEFEKWVKELNFSEIYGELVEGTDCDNPDKLKYFYSKNGYTIINNTRTNGSYAEISKKI
ncbi:hypothetical protein INR75_19810 [Zunongwangia sp. SCSIO 43204]|uniref:hypothetical protein n=1 Tax=Zunongwangia sp. SCSIO 43204 TaxID=2779359 RepID=UPI001CA93327|nr:hypothetical protein [Zunongwangia sp. SCSIO 43204]UAB84371.1 hypothetical protein INR75_19810 [Zunongwangia sp. SCSIO 43204]